MRWRRTRSRHAPRRAAPSAATSNATSSSPASPSTTSAHAASGAPPMCGPRRPRHRVAVGPPAGPAPLEREPEPSDPLPEADVLVDHLDRRRVASAGRRVHARCRQSAPLVPLRPALRVVPAEIRGGAPARLSRRLGQLPPDPHRATRSPLLQVGAAPQPGRRAHRRRHRHASRGRPGPPAHRRGQAEAGDHHRHVRRDVPRPRARRCAGDPRCGVPARAGVPQRALRPTRTARHSAVAPAPHDGPRPHGHARRAPRRARLRAADTATDGRAIRCRASQHP